jgi:hypothetical protein
MKTSETQTVKEQAMDKSKNNDKIVKTEKDVKDIERPVFDDEELAAMFNLLAEVSVAPKNQMRMYQDQIMQKCNNYLRFKSSEGK